MDRDRRRPAAGTALVAAGFVSILGIITAEALYPGYSTADQTVSALGAASGDAGAVQPSATIFNGAMVVSGALVVVAAFCLRNLFEARALPVVVAVTGAGVAGVGLFPAQYAVPHAVAAFVAFGGSGLSALVTAAVVGGGFRYVSAALGVVTLVALAGFVALGGATPLGIGGLERWITYPAQVWVVAFGGFLLGGGAARAGE